MSPGLNTNYTVNVDGSGGFNGAVSFTVSDLPAGASATFTPASVTGSGASTLTISVNKPAQPGTYRLVISGSSGNLSHSANVTLAIQ